MPLRKRTPIERIFSEVFNREMSSSEREVLLVKPIETRNSNGITPKRLITRAETSIVAMNNEKTLPVSSSQISRAVMGLREMLLRGEFQPGERIAEIPLSSRLGVSRTPLRLAFEKLANEGLIKEHPYSGFAASEFSIDDIWEAIETRSILEGAAARLAAKRLKNPAHLEQSAGSARHLEQQGDGAARAARKVRGSRIPHRRGSRGDRETGSERGRGRSGRPREDGNP